MKRLNGAMKTIELMAYLLLTLVSKLVTPASRPTDYSVSLVLSSGDAIMLTPSTSRPTNNSIGMERLRARQCTKTRSKRSRIALKTSGCPQPQRSLSTAQHKQNRWVPGEVHLSTEPSRLSTDQHRKLSHGKHNLVTTLLIPVDVKRVAAHWGLASRGWMPTVPWHPGPGRQQHCAAKTPPTLKLNV
ncbi:hypothetical protein Taro_013718 [Colocasia esculenta]|uniref:Secreted protein n=1 Tax=Colocasia esculenta TaxID=4460 RepID=A0A843UGY5_COLES|nr:hypothetical protein [Colocasia esculenta]